MNTGHRNTVEYLFSYKENVIRTRIRIFISSSRYTLTSNLYREV